MGRRRRPIAEATDRSPWSTKQAHAAAARSGARAAPTEGIRIDRAT